MSIVLIQRCSDGSETFDFLFAHVDEVRRAMVGYGMLDQWCSIRSGDIVVAMDKLFIANAGDQWMRIIPLEKAKFLKWSEFRKKNTNIPGIWSRDYLDVFLGM